MDITTVLTAKDVLGGALFIGYLYLSRERIKNSIYEYQSAFKTGSRAS